MGFLQLGNFQLAVQQACGGVIYNDNKQLFPWMAPEVLAGRIPTMVSICIILYTYFMITHQSPYM